MKDAGSVVSIVGVVAVVVLTVVVSSTAATWWLGWVMTRLTEVFCWISWGYESLPEGENTFNKETTHCEREIS